MLIYNRNRELARWAGDRIGVRDFGPCVAIGVAVGEEIVAAAVYNKYLHPNIEITFVTSSPRWASKGAVRGILSYPFLQLKCRRVTATTEATNQRARAFLCHLGFRQEGYHPEALPTGDAVTYGLMRKDAARWLEEKPGVETNPSHAPESGPDRAGADGIEHLDRGRQFDARQHQQGHALRHD